MDAIIGILKNIGFDWKVALANLVNFLIIFWLLNRFIFGSIRKTLAKRKEVIEKGVTDAKSAETALMMAEEEKKKIIIEAEKQSSAIGAEAYNKAKQTVDNSVKIAEKEAEKVLSNAQKEIEKRNKEAEKELHNKTVDIVVSGVEKVLSSEMNSELEEKIVKNLTA